jgi:protein phosphatase
MARVEFGQVTDAGRVRSNNQDAIGNWPCNDGLLFAVADGVGGNAGGETASQLALEVLERGFAEASEKWPTAKKLRRAIQDANLRIYQMGITVPELRGMSTTLTATAVVGSSLVTAHVGDCRLLLFRDGKLTQLTKDHTWVAEQVAYGLLSAAQAQSHRDRHVLSRSLGKELIVPIDVVSTDLQDGDMLLQCSDGVHGVLPETALVAALQEADPEAGCKQLLERALDAGTRDNLSAQIAVVTDCEPPAPKRSWWNIRRRG